MPACFLDTNILLRFLTRDDEQKAQQALDLLLRIERGEEKVITSPLVIFETIFIYEVFTFRIRASTLGLLIFTLAKIFPLPMLTTLFTCNPKRYRRSIPGIKISIRSRGLPE